MRIAVIGGGIAGLAAAYRLQQESMRPIVFEKDGGGRTDSDRVDGFIIDKGAYTIPESHRAFLTLMSVKGSLSTLISMPWLDMKGSFF